jgi:hypothetical protein
LKKKIFFFFSSSFLFFSIHIYLGFGRQHFSCSLGRGNHSFLFDFLFHFYRLFIHSCLFGGLSSFSQNKRQRDETFLKRIFLSKCLTKHDYMHFFDFLTLSIQWWL